MARRQRDKQSDRQGDKQDKAGKPDQEAQADKPGKADKSGDPASFFNPFAVLGKNLKQNENSAKPAAGNKPAGLKAGGRNAPYSPGKANAPNSTGAPAWTGSSSASFLSGAPEWTGAPEDTDAALFLNAVSSNNFKPLRKEGYSGRSFEPVLRQQDKRGARAEASGKERALASPERERTAQRDLGQPKQAERPSQDFEQPDKSGRDFEQPDKSGQDFEQPDQPGQGLEQSGQSGQGYGQPDQSGEEAEFFARAMQGVRPVESRGRETPRKPVLADTRRKLAADLNRAYLEEFLQGKVEFALEYTEEFFEGHVMGLDPVILSKLRAGRYSPESHVDLHGQNAEQAYAVLVEFIRHSYNKGQRSLVVVTGRGKNSPGGFSVLRQNMQNWLTRDPLKRVVLAFCTAQPKDGGAGAIYVLLRKLKKSGGKIRWDINAPNV